MSMENYEVEENESKKKWVSPQLTIFEYVIIETSSQQFTPADGPGNYS